MEIIYFVSPESDKRWREDAEQYAASGTNFYATDIQNDEDIHFLTTIAQKYRYKLSVDAQNRYVFSKLQPDTTTNH